MGFVRSIITTIKWVALSLIALTLMYYFFLFFAYDMNPSFIHMHHCAQNGGTWDAQHNLCKQM